MTDGATFKRATLADWRALACEQHREIKRLEAERDALRGVLRPFADALELTKRDMGFDVASQYRTADCLRPYLRMQHFAEALAILTFGEVLSNPPYGLRDPE